MAAFLLVSRPVVSSEATKLLGGNVPRSVALLIDQSMSMGYKSGDEQLRALLADARPQSFRAARGRRG